VLDTQTGRLSLPDGKLASFSYDALRVYWRVAMDWELFRDPRAERYLKDTLGWPIARWEASARLPAAVSSSGSELAEYESGEMLAALMPAMRAQRPEIAAAMERKLRSVYKSGLWADQAGTRHPYYLQNWAWFGTALYARRLGPVQAFAAKKN
jgi:endoglucanase